MWPGPRLCSARRYGVFDPPFRWFKPRDLLEMGTADKNYRGLTRFIAEAGDRLRPGGRILLNFGTSGDIDYLYRRIEKAGLSKEVTPYGEATRDGMTARYYTIRMLFIGSAEDASLRAVATSPLLGPTCVGLDSSTLMSEPVPDELGVALTQLVAALERVRLEALEPGDRDLVERALLAARAALQRATVRDEPFHQED
jgi:hypothetical protein